MALSFVSLWLRPDRSFTCFQLHSKAPPRLRHENIKEALSIDNRPRRSEIVTSSRKGCTNAGSKVLPQQDEFSWTALISQHTKSGQGREALRVYEKMRVEGVKPSSYTFVAALKACSRLGDLGTGKRIHAHVIESGEESHVFVATMLVDMYAKCGSLVEARQVFEKMPHRGVVSWNAIILGYAQMGEGEEALRLYMRMQEEGMVPDDRTFVGALKACSSMVPSVEVRECDGKLLKKWWLEQGRRIHSDVVNTGFASDVFVATMLVDMYGKYGSMVDARLIFEKMPHRSVVSWNAMILGYAQMEESEVTLQLYARMQQEGVVPDERTFVGVLKGCSTLAGLEEGKEVDGKLVKILCLERGRAIHSEIVKSGFESDVFVGNLLLDMYGKCGSMVDARNVFEKMQRRDVVSWTAMILGYAQMEKGDMALHLYAQMQVEGVLPNARTFVGALKACSTLASLEEGKENDGKIVRKQCLEQGISIHSEIVKRGFGSDVFVATMLVNMYGKCGSMSDARLVFETMPHRSVVSWNAIIFGYAQMEEGEVALELYARMRQEGIAPDERTFVCALIACISLAESESKLELEEENEGDGKFATNQWLEQGRAIHTEAVKRGFNSDMYVANMLVDMYAKCGSMADALSVFDKMQHRSVVSWTAMILGYAQIEEGELALQFYARMRQECIVPDEQTFVGALKACRSLAASEEIKEADGKLVQSRWLEQGREIHSNILKFGLESDVFLATLLVDMYGKCRSMVDARHVFEKMPHRSAVSWNTVILGHARMGEDEVALELYARMLDEGVPPNARTFVAAVKSCSSLAALDDTKLAKNRWLAQGIAIHSEVVKRGYDSDVFLSNMLVDMYRKCGSMVHAQHVFDTLSRRDLIAFQALIGGYAERGEAKEAFKIYAQMQEQGLSANSWIFVSILEACGNAAALEKGMEIHAEISAAGLGGSPIVATALIDMYGKCGNMGNAQEVFDALLTRDFVTWNALIAGYARQGLNDVVCHLFERMRQEGVQPDVVTFLSLLTVCTHAGLVHTGQLYFEAMSRDYGITPTIKHYNCMVDLLGRAGQLEEAVALANEMPFQPNAVTWITMLGACRKWNDIEVGTQVFKRLLRLDKNSSASYILMSRIYVDGHMWEEAKHMRATRVDARAWKKPGRSWWTDSGGIVHTFVVGDKEHPDSEHIYAKVRDLNIKTKDKVCVPQFPSVSEDIPHGEQKESCEQVAIYRPTEENEWRKSEPSIQKQSNVGLIESGVIFGEDVGYARRENGSSPKSPGKLAQQDLIAGIALIDGQTEKFEDGEAF